MTAMARIIKSQNCKRTRESDSGERLMWPVSRIKMSTKEHVLIKEIRETCVVPNLKGKREHSYVNGSLNETVYNTDGEKNSRFTVAENPGALEKF